MKPQDGERERQLRLQNGLTARATAASSVMMTTLSNLPPSIPLRLVADSAISVPDSASSDRHHIRTGQRLTRV
eukprot:2624819-Rhodomonas_salina.5